MYSAIERLSILFGRPPAFYRDAKFQDYAAVSVVALFAYIFSLVVYRLFLSPIARFPGSKLAAATEWYEFYFQLFKDGQWGNQVTKLHEEYGPIVRITPWELSIRDSSFYNQVYVGSSRRRTNMWARGLENNDSHHMTVDHDLHRKRRKHLEGFFSRQKVNGLEDVIAGKVRLLDKRLQSMHGTNEVVPINRAFSAMTGDIIGHVSCGAHLGLIEDVNFSPDWHDLLKKMVLMTPVFRCFGWLNKLLQMLPASIIERIYPKSISNMMMGEIGKRYVEDIKNSIQKGEISAKDSEKSVFHHLLLSGVPESEISPARLQAESMILLLAGTFTSSLTMSMIIYHVLNDPHIEKRLREDLRDVMVRYPTQNPLWADLEKVPYLVGCIKEGLRLYSIIGNLPRCSPDVLIEYKEWKIPRNTPVGMSIRSMATDPAVFSEPLRFAPERWLGDYNPLMDRNYVPFTLGSRNCIGMNLALAEIHLAIAVIFRPGGPKLSLFETDKSDAELVRDYIIGFPKRGSKDIRVSVN